MPKKKTSAAAPWEVTADMFLTERETESLLGFVRRRERSANRKPSVKEATDRLIVELLLFSGLRNSELCHLRVADVANGHGESAVRVVGTPRQDRMVYIPVSLTRVIEQYVSNIRPSCVSEESGTMDASQPLILNERGRTYDRTALYRRVVRILTEAGLGERASVQLLRHTYGFLAYKRTGGNLLFVQRQLGHAHPMVTAVYAQFVQFSDVELANRVSDDKTKPPMAAQKELDRERSTKVPLVPGAEAPSKPPVAARTKGSKR